MKSTHCYMVTSIIKLLLPSPVIDVPQGVDVGCLVSVYLCSLTSAELRSGSCIIQHVADV